MRRKLSIISGVYRWDLAWYWENYRRMEAHQRGPRGERADIEAHDYAISLRTTEVVRQLVSILGATTVAAIGGVSEIRAVAQWITGREPQRPHVLRFALQIAMMVAPADDGDVVKAWFVGSNPLLNDQAPVVLLRTRPLEEIQTSLMAAARTFASRYPPESRTG